MSKQLTLSASIAVLSMMLFVAIVSQGRMGTAVSHTATGAPTGALGVSGQLSGS